jgi:monovalent cation/hydrogen antiporter
MEFIEITLGLLLAVAAVAAIGKWLPVPLPILLVAGGVVLSYVPLFDSVQIDPEIFFLLFIPPLLFADGWLIPKRELLGVLRPVILLAFGLVFLTVIVVGYFVHWLIPAIPLAAAFALGAVVSPTDAVAVSAIATRLKIPSRATTIIKGESLINDASGLVAFRFAIAAAVTGHFSWSDAAMQFVLTSSGGFVLGLAVAWVIGRIRVGLAHFSVNDPVIDTVISVLTPFAAYLGAEALHVGSILAVVGAGLYAGINDPRNIDAPTRAHAWEVWRMLLFTFNGLVFLLLGVQLRSVVVEVSRFDALQLAGYAVALSLVLIVLRIVWVFPATYLPPMFSKRIRKREGIHNPRLVLVTAWAGVRGSVTLAAALSIPLTTATGASFPGRDRIILLAASVIVITLLLNGLTLPLLVRALKIRGDRKVEREERAARIATAQAAIVALRKKLPELKATDDVAFAKSLLAHYAQWLDRHSANAERRHHLDRKHDARRELWLAALRAERDELTHMRKNDVIDDEVHRRLQTDLDLRETLIAGVSEDAN